MNDTTRLIALVGFLALVAPAFLFALRDRRAAVRNGLIWLLIAAVIAAAAAVGVVTLFGDIGTAARMTTPMWVGVGREP